jgi:heme/copper-type cytochrome/quinol oxidase subunit 4
MTPRWWAYVTVFVIGVTLTIAGFALANPGFVLVGILISVVLFFSRRFLE